ncbi:MAG TPA: DUF4105 domain-containing protein [Flavisolibacter sp.]|nr:DUF4105 domain-containing protein [Flavisolibacter sp.]
MKQFLLSLFLLVALKGASQDSCQLRISLLTCAPGEELYSTFGHTAIRVQDMGRNADLVFNYGTFEFGPDFYSEFIRGKLRYALSIESFTDFLYNYQAESRSVQEQEIRMDCAEKTKLYQALMENAREANRYYRYDFLFDNCTTRAKDMISKNASGPVVFQNILPARKPSFRDLIHSYLDAGHQPWSKLGIDILLGVKLDRIVTNEQAMFLPDYLLKGMDHTTAAGQPLVTPPRMILSMPSLVGDKTIFTPAVIFSMVLLLFAALYFSRTKKAQRILGALDFLLFFPLGLAGLLLLFMWFGTDHVVCRQNFNLLWALPSHALMAFLIYSKARWVRIYFRITAVIGLLLLLTWFLLPQHLNEGLIPLVLLLTFRSFILSKTKPHAATNRLRK